MISYYRQIAITTLSCFSALWLSQDANAQKFTYAEQDLVLGFRKIGVNGGTKGVYDFEVNLGQATNYYGAALGASINITNYTAGQITSMFDNLNDMTWSVGGYVSSVPSDPNLAPSTLWTTRPRSAPAVQSTPWTVSSSDAQKLTVAEIRGILSGARTYGGSQPADPINNTPTAIRIPDGNGFDYSTYIGPDGDYASTFQGNVEQNTPSDFTVNTLTSVVDLYQLVPGPTPVAGTYLGYFQLSHDGTMVFVRATSTPPPPPPAPTLAITRAGTTSTVSFNTTNGATYTLHFTNSAGLRAFTSTWPVATSFTANSTGPVSLQDNTSDPNRVYRVEAH